MGKSSDYSTSVSVNGDTKATSNSSGTSYYMSDVEQQIYDYAQNSFADNLSQVNVFSADTQQNIADQIEAYTDQGIEIINDTYTPMLEDLQTDIASRFGNYDNSSFLSQLSEIESYRSDSMSDLAQDVLVQQDTLVSNELAEQYEYLSFLNDIYTSMDSTALSYMGLANDNSSLSNAYSTSQTDTTMSYINLLSNLTSFI
ncbi:MAG: hypothetical protein R3Y28_08750 [Candidatus Gastranaerophilales bacterium]